MMYLKLKESGSVQTGVLSFDVCGRHGAVVARRGQTPVSGRNPGRLLASDRGGLPRASQPRLGCELHVCHPLGSLLLQLLQHNTRGSHRTVMWAVTILTQVFEFLNCAACKGGVWWRTVIVWTSFINVQRASTAHWATRLLAAEELSLFFQFMV